MVKINHSRPYLKYIDNIRREANKATQRYQPENASISRPKGSSQAKRITFWDKMAAIELTVDENELIFLLFEKTGEYFDTSSDAISLILAKGKGKRRKKLQAESELIYRELVSIGEQLVASEILEQYKGRKEGVFAWLNLLKPKLIRDGADGLWDLINNHVLKEAFDAVERRLDNLSP